MKCLHLLVFFTIWTLGAGLYQAQSGTLTVTRSILTGGQIDLTAEGVLDWAHWGLTAPTDFDEKAGVTPQISNWVPVGTATALQYDGNAVGYTWSDGTPNPAVTDTATGIYMIGLGNGFEVDVPATDTPLFFHLYVGAWAATMHLEASLSDNSAPGYSDETLTGNAGNGVCSRYTIGFAAGSPGQTLKVRFWVIAQTDPGGNVTLQAASLEPVPPLSVTDPVVSPGNLVTAGTLVSLQVQAQGAFPIHYQWQVDNGSGFAAVPSSNTNALSVPTASLLGAYTYEVVVTNIYGGVTSGPVMVTVIAPTGTLVASPANLAEGLNIDLTAEGVLDWAHWGLTAPTDFDEKAGVTSQISNYILVGAGSVYQYDNNAMGYTWSDGTPNPTADATTTGIYIAGVGNGFEVDVPASDTPLLFQIYLGAWEATMHFEASLSDNSAPVFSDDTYTGHGDSRRYSLLFAAASPGQTLKVRFWVAANLIGGGNITLQAASLEPVPQLSVTDPIISPANMVAAGTTVSLQVQAQGAFPFHYQWRVDHGSGFVPVPDSNSNLLSVATAALKGDYSYDVIVTNTSGSVTSAPALLTVTVPQGTLVASPDDLPSGLNVDLTAEGLLDWAHWGLSSVGDFDDKAGVTSQISNYVPVGTATALQYGGNTVGYTWSDGTPNPAINDTATGIYMIGMGDGFEVDVPATDTPVFLNMYVGAWAATMHFEASLSDNSAPGYSDETLTADNGDGVTRRYTIFYAAASPGQTLKVRFWVIAQTDPGGNVTLQAASLQPVPPLSVSEPVISPGNVVSAGTLATLQVQAQGAIPFYYQWRVDHGSGFVGIPNSNTNTLSVPTANLLGDYTYEVVVTNTSGAVTSAPVLLSVTAPHGTLAASGTDLAAGLNIDLTAEGVLDWAHWGLNLVTDFDEKAGVIPQISNYTPIGTATVYQFGDNTAGYTWSDGTPDPAINDTATGIYIGGIGNGFEVDVPAADTPMFFNIYVGAWAATMHFEASLSDNSAPVYSDETLTAGTGDGANRRYSILYAAAAPGQTLKVRFWVAAHTDPGGNVTLQSASLQNAPASLSLQWQRTSDGGVQLTWPLGRLFEAVNANGPWAPTDATSPYTFLPSGPRKFFRARIP